MKVVKRKARTDLYRYGKFTENKDRKSGYSFTRSKPNPDGDELVVKKGQEYYMWGLWGEKKHRISTSYPKPQQLTKSKFKSFLYDLIDMMEGGSSLELVLNELKIELQAQEEKVLSLRPHLRNIHVGEIINKRIAFIKYFLKLIEVEVGREFLIKEIKGYVL